MINYKRVLFALARGALRRRQMATDDGEIIGWATHEDGQHYPIHAAQGGGGSSGSGKQAKGSFSKNDPQYNKNHPYWKTPEGKAERYFEGRMQEQEFAQYTREAKIQNIYEAGGEKVSELQSKAASINNEIDRIQRKRGKLTKEEEKRLETLYKQRVPVEREANAWANKYREFREKYKPKEKEVFQSVKLENLK